MIRYQWNGHLQRCFICDACGGEITDPSQVRLLREAGALPEEPPSYVHVKCVPHFLEEHEGLWQTFLLSSPTAAWYI